jgi:hypothetical protein
MKEMKHPWKAWSQAEKDQLKELITKFDKNYNDYLPFFPSRNYS